MLAVDLEIRNYRCFGNPVPARFTLERGIVAFVGPNNGGKSTLLRFLYEFRQLFNALSNPGGLQRILSHPRSTSVNFPGVEDVAELFSNQNSEDIEFFISIRTDAPAPPTLPGRQGTAAHLTTVGASLSRSSPHHPLLWACPAGTNCAFTPTVSAAGEYVTHAGGGRELHVGLMSRAFKILSDSLYVGAFRNILNVGGNDDYYDLPVGEKFVARWDVALNSGTKAENEAAHAIIQDIEEIFGFRRLMINPSTSRRSLQIYIDGKSYRLGEVGSGLAQFVIVMFMAAFRRPELVLIDEPELNLHPMMQRAFLSRLQSYAKFATLFATHSLGLARSQADRIYSLQRNKENIAVVKDFDAVRNVPELLGELSYSGQYDLGYKKILLVEGVTELKTVQQILRKLKCDQEITLLPLGGSSLINSKPSTVHALAEIRRITVNLFALVDSETESSGSAPGKSIAGFRKVCRRLGIDLHVLGRRSTENYFSDAAIKSVQGETFSALGEHGAVPSGWSKQLNWMIARQMAINEFLDADLGQFLQHVKDAALRTGPSLVDASAAAESSVGLSAAN